MAALEHGPMTSPPTMLTAEDERLPAMGVALDETSWRHPWRRRAGDFAREGGPGAARGPPGRPRWPARSSASMASCLPGMASSVKRAATLGDALGGPSRITRNCTIREDRERSTGAHDQVAPRRRKVPKGVDDLAPPSAAQQDEPRRRESRARAGNSVVSRQQRREGRGA